MGYKDFEYEYILYSRTLVEDYRWIIVPELILPENLQKLRQLYDACDNNAMRAMADNPEVKPLYCLSLTDITVLLRFERTAHTDRNSRSIYALQGICVNKNQDWRFRDALPWLLNESNPELNVWEQIDFQEADSWTKKPSKKYPFDSKQTEQPLPPIENNSQVSSQRNNLYSSKIIKLDFSKEGLHQLQNLLRNKQVDFAFGTTSNMVNLFKSLRIVAPQNISLPQEMDFTSEHGSRQNLPPPKNMPTQPSGGLMSSVKNTFESFGESIGNFFTFSKPMNPMLATNPSLKSSKYSSPTPNSATQELVAYIKQLISTYHPASTLNEPSITPYMIAPQDSSLIIGVPKLVIEVSDNHNPISQNKVNSIAKAGIIEYWLIDVMDKSVTIYTETPPPRRYKINTYSRHATIYSVAIDDLEIKTSDLFDENK